jgi:hypothetical protein
MICATVPSKFPENGNYVLHRASWSNNRGKTGKLKK